jgi:predicted double-glycine peptidase
MLPLPFNYDPLRATWNYKENNKTDNNMPVQINTVTISLDEYNNMRQSLDTLHNALEDNKVIIRSTGHNPYTYMTCQMFTRDEALNKVAKKYYELENTYKASQQNYEALASELDWIEKTWWFRLGKWWNNR